MPRLTVMCVRRVNDLTYSRGTHLDDVAPLLEIVAPEPHSRVDLPEGAETVGIPVVIEVSDPGGWGVGEAQLVIEQNGQEQARPQDPARVGDRRLLRGSR